MASFNGVRVREEPASEAALQVWSEAGLPAGNHTWSHKNLNQLSVADFEKEITENEPTLRRWFSAQDWHWFRYPFLAEGDTSEKKNAIRQFLGEHGYKIGAVTMSFGDYMWNEPYARCAAKKDDAAIAKLERSYLESAEGAVRFYRASSQAANGRDIPYVLLMHIGAFDARMLPRLIELYRKDGFEFVTLEQAERDPFYKSSVEPGTTNGLDSLEGAMAERHIAAPHHQGPAVDLSSICR